MATSKAADKKAAPITKTAVIADPKVAFAEEILAIKFHRALVGLGEPARVNEILRVTGEETVASGLARHILVSHPSYFAPIDRRWDLTQRRLPSNRPVGKTIEELIAHHGSPVSVEHLAAELVYIYGRHSEHFEEVAQRLLQGQQFFPVSDGAAYGFRAWLLDVSSNNVADIQFYNYLSGDIPAGFQAAAAEGDWINDPAHAAYLVLAAAGGKAVDNRLLQYLAWNILEDEFDAVAIYDAINSREDLFLALPDHRWLLTEALEPVREEWKALSVREAHADGDEPVVEIEADAPILPLEITETDEVDILKYFGNSEDAVTVSGLLQHVFEVKPGSRSYTEDLASLSAYLKSHSDNYLWVGAERFREPDTLPPYIGQVPESLSFPVLPRFETADGEILDQLLDDAAFEEGLADDILDARAQDCADQEPADRTLWPEGVSAASPWLRLVLKAHHKEIGTFPLSQIPYGFFPTEPNIVEITVKDGAGNSFPVYIDYDVQLAYGLFDLYESVAAESGAVFHLEKTELPSVYKFVYNNETDSGVFVTPNRFVELAQFRAEVEGGSLISTYDIIRRILDHYRKGSSFLTLLTEVNLVRRTPRRLIASILSGYAAFHQRANRWTFDPKKEPEGFDKSKTRYIQR